MSDEIRQAIDECGLSRYGICKAIGLNQSVMSRFMSGQGGLSFATLDAIADLLKLGIVARGRAVEIPKQKPGRKPKVR